MAARHDSHRPLRTAAFAAAAFALLAAPLALEGQRTDDRWLAWLGCWEPVSEEADVRSSDAGASAGLVCFQPLAGDVGIEMISVVEGEIASRRTIRADGERSDVELEGCSGWERAEFATRRGRVYVTSEQACDGGVTRSSTGLLTMVSSAAWVDVRAVEVEGESSTWVTRYRAASLEDAAAVGLGDIAADRELAVRSARVAGAARPSVDDIIEASERVAPEAVGAWIAEAGMPLSLDADELVRLADAGVSEEVIDMAVAVSYPEHFAVAREPERREAEYERSYGGRLGLYPYYDPFFGSFFFSPFYSPYGYYGLYSPYGRRYGYGFGYGIGGGGVYIPVTIDRDRDSGARVISGQGYRRGQASSGSGRTATPRAAPTGSSGGAVRRSGGSSRSQPTGRTAKKRGGGGGD